MALVLGILLPHIASASKFCQQISVVEFRVAEKTPAPELQAALDPGSRNLVHLHCEVLITADDILSASAKSADPVPANGDEASLIIEFREAAVEKISQLSEQMAKRRIALLINGRVAVVATWYEGPLSTGAITTRIRTQADADRLAQDINEAISAR